jgi:tripartite-type tricarboxylate transporter receptor subunit TctC
VVTLLSGPVAAVALAPLGAALAQPAWPTKPVRIVVPFPPGGTNDIVARILARELSEALGQPFVVENRPGASGVIGAEIVAKSPPDGYTLMVHSVSHIANAFAYRKLPYDTLKDFEPLALLAAQPGIVVVHPSLPVKTLKEFLALARVRPGEITYASNGEGGSLHVQMAVLAAMANVKLVHVPFKGGAPALASIVAGETQAGTMTIGVALGQIKAGRLRPLAVTSERRSALFPDLPTVAEAGVPGYDMNPWTGLFAPAGLARAPANRLLPEVNRIVRRPEFAKLLAEQAVEPWIGTAEEFAARIRTDHERYEKFFRLLGIPAS